MMNMGVGKLLPREWTSARATYSASCRCTRNSSKQRGAVFLAILASRPLAAWLQKASWTALCSSSLTALRSNC